MSIIGRQKHNCRCYIEHQPLPYTKKVHDVYMHVHVSFFGMSICVNALCSTYVHVSRHLLKSRYNHFTGLRVLVLGTLMLKILLGL
jgi:hypothetical protein